MPNRKRSRSAKRAWREVPDRTARTAPGRAAFMARFDQAADPDGTLSPAERAERAAQLRSEYFAGLSTQQRASGGGDHAA